MRTLGTISSIFLCLLTVGVLIISGLCSPVLAAAGGDVPIDNVGRFELDLVSGGGADPSSDWYSVSGGEQIIHPPEPGASDDTRDIEFDEIKIRGPLAEGVTRDDLLDWLNGWSKGKDGKRVNGTLDLLNGDGKPARTFEFRSVFPTSYQPPSVNISYYDILEEILTFKPMYIDGPSNPGRGISEEQDFDGEVLTGGLFLFQIEGMELQLFSCTPGGMELILEETVGGDEPWDNKPGQGSGTDWMIGDDPWDNKPGNGAGSDWIGGDEPWENKPGRGGGADWVGGDEPWDNKFNYMSFEVVEVEFGTWTIQKEYDRADLTLRNLFDDFASGRRRPNPADSGTLIYLDSAGSEARSIDFFGYAPTSYDVVNVDSGSGGVVLMEVMEFSVMHCTYA